MFPSTEFLLNTLGWPAQAGRSLGTLSWTKAMGEGSHVQVMAASVMVNDAMVTCRMRSAQLAHPSHLEPHLEVVWNVRGPSPQLKRWVVDGRDQDIHEPSASEEALMLFRNTVAAMDVRPLFLSARTLGSEQDNTWVSP